MELSLAIMTVGTTSVRAKRVGSHRDQPDARLERQACLKTLVTTVTQQVQAAQAQGFPVTGPVVTVDEALAGPWFGWRQAWAAQSPTATHHAVLQDDIAVCADLPQTLCRLITARPQDFISGFQRGTRDGVQRLALNQGIRWTVERVFLGALLVVMPVELGARAIKWIAGHEDPKWGRSADTRLQMFLRAERRAAYIPVPFPVDHLGVPSTLGHKRLRATPILWRGDAEPLADLTWHDVRAL